MKKNPENTLAIRLKELRLEKGITQRQLAAEIGVSYGAIVGYENGRREPNSKAMAALEQYFGVSGEFLRGGVDRDAFMENIPVIHAELDRVIARMGQFKDAYTVSNQDEQALATSVLSQALELITKNLLQQNKPINMDYQEITGPFAAVFQLNAAGRAELNKRAEELQQLAQYKK
ncbi:helix-turn-helix transcriptional regulator [Oscillospiraceae bacterium 21-37]|uniref:helix-turn-helix domain-containing protein n=1 Tax=Acutalibacter caecimuris TaxID=3093657 RepID=UPI002AC9D00F|nr:helix-turn-helix transcriptional regulator [Acutalibacter sp. M00118]